MDSIDYNSLLAACRPGGASVLTSRTELAPAAGDLAGVAPARFVDGTRAVYAYETRFDGDSAVSAVVIDSKGSALNRIEAAISQAIQDGDLVLSRTPRVSLTYEGLPDLTEMDLPHRVFDGHLRAGTIDGQATTDHATYRAARDSNPANAKAMLELSPISLVLGAWDSTRKSNQGRYRSALVGEIIGVLADQSNAGRTPPQRGAGRSDSIAPSVKVPGPDMERLAAAQEHELSARNLKDIRSDIAKAKTGTVSGAALGLGSIPPSMNGLGFVSCRKIIRHHVLSFSALRQLRFGLGADGDAAARALLAALALNGLARSDSELLLRANCDLVETAPTVVELDARHGQKTSLAPLSIDEADALLSTAIDSAVSAGVNWSGQVLAVTGNPLVAGGISADEA